MFYAFGVNVVGLFLLNNAIRQAKMLAFANAVRFAGNRDKYEEFAEIPVLLRSVPRNLRSVGRNREPRTLRAAWLWTILPRLRLGYCFVTAGKYARSCVRSLSRFAWLGHRPLDKPQNLRTRSPFCGIVHLRWSKRRA